MARIRTIKPEFPHSESMGRVSRDARLLFVELWTICDDEGRTRGSSRMLASLLFPYDDDARDLIGGWLDELEREGCIARYEVEGDHYLQVCKWRQHQRIDHASKSKFPPPGESSRILASPRELSCQDLDQGPRTKEGTKEPRADAREPSRSAPDKPPELTDQVWSDWQAHRRAIKAPLTATAIAGFRREADKAGVPFADAVVMSIAQGWRGFQAKFVKDSVPQPDRNAPVVKGPQPIFHRSDDPDCPCENCERDRRRKAQ